MIRLLTILVPTIFEMRKATSTAVGAATSFIPVFQRELKSGIMTASGCLMAVALASFALIKILLEAETFLRQFVNAEAYVFALYSVVLLLGAWGLYYLLPSEPSLRKGVDEDFTREQIESKRVSQQMLAVAWTGFKDGFVGSVKTHRREALPELVDERPRAVAGFY